jgi:hypothetical protein
MSINLYQEAIIEAKQLRAMAETNAKNKIIEAVTPKIRRLIEQQLSDEELEDEELVIGDEELETELTPPPLDDLGALGAPGEITLDLGAMAPEAESSSSVAVQVSPGADVEVEIDSDGSVEIDTGEVELELGGGDDIPEEEDLLMGQEEMVQMENFFNRYSKDRKLKNRLNELHRNVRTLSRTLSEVNLRTCKPIYSQIATIYYANLVKEAYKLSNQIILINESTDERLDYKLLLILKEIKNMSRRSDAAAFRRLFEQLTAAEGLSEQEDELDLGAEEEVDVGEEEELEIDAPAAETALGDLAAAMGLEVVEEEEVDVEEEVEVDLEEGDDAGDDEDKDEGAVDEVYEIDEAAIRRELRKLRRLREQEEGRAAAADPALNHGGEDEGDVFIDVDEDTLLNALADELGDPAVPTPTVESRRRRRRMSRGSHRARRVNESRRRAPRRRSRSASVVSERVHKAERANGRLKKQLQEMNLFNAKLLFANKLMQNRALSTKSQRSIVEALDSAKTIREAKLLYKSLSSSLNRSSGKTLTESRSRLLASSSRSTRSGSPANNGVVADRWAVLAGLNEGK